MSTIYYQSNGKKVTNITEIETDFYIQENVGQTLFDSRYFYRGDSINYDLDNVCVELYDVFLDKIFDSRDDYYEFIGALPQGITRGGLDSDFDIPKENFQKYFEKNLIELIPSHLRSTEIVKLYEQLDLRKNDYAYLADCQSMINSVQELLQTCQSNFVFFYKMLCNIEPIKDFCDDFYGISMDGRLAISSATTLFISLYSIFDLLTKIEYELENIRDSSSSYPKMASKKILYGDAKDLKGIKFEGTIFEKNRNISIVENLRNEFVHNATWEMNSKIFFRLKEGKLIEKCVYLPDFNNEGYLVAYKNRKRFFAQGIKLNEELPNIYYDVLSRILVTLQRMK